ncbi:helix-turn-helix transcriptional regulator [Clostridiaceae bacterium NSJ-31]|uniref:Helix-turn-helix transcriptional regulator n=1 Tax=Ligaoa zhengdingensis TaxID=2763658 RepID=A0A926E0J6_9FIRM|nr:helix-turn-helix transcriptional regulator [Ligaoa zhengdingensis]
MAGGKPYAVQANQRPREDQNLSQRQLAEILHMHKTTYARYETEEREIPFDIAIMLAKYYNVSLDYIAGLTQQKEIK